MLLASLEHYNQFAPDPEKRYAIYRQELSEESGDFEFYPLFNSGRYGVQVEVMWYEIFEGLLSSNPFSNPTLVDYGSGFCLSGMMLKERLESDFPDSNPRIFAQNLERMDFEQLIAECKRRNALDRAEPWRKKYDELKAQGIYDSELLKADRPILNDHQISYFLRNKNRINFNRGDIFDMQWSIPRGSVDLLHEAWGGFMHCNVMDIKMGVLGGLMSDRGIIMTSSWKGDPTDKQVKNILKQQGFTRYEEIMLNDSCYRIFGRKGSPMPK